MIRYSGKCRSERYLESLRVPLYLVPPSDAISRAFGWAEKLQTLNSELPQKYDRWHEILTEYISRHMSFPTRCIARYIWDCKRICTGVPAGRQKLHRRHLARRFPPQPILV